MYISGSKVRKYTIWALLALPALYVLYNYCKDIITYGEVIHKTGELSVYLLLLSLAITPLRRIFTTAAWTRWLLYHRRAIGVASFGYAALHTFVYLERKWGHGLILKEGLKPELLTGWIAFTIFLVLALTSNNRLVQKLKTGWQKLHRFVYLATALTIAHWALATWEFKAVIIYSAILLSLQTIRVIKLKR